MDALVVYTEKTHEKEVWAIRTTADAGLLCCDVDRDASSRWPAERRARVGRDYTLYMKRTRKLGRGRKNLLLRFT